MLRLVGVKVAFTFRIENRESSAVLHTLEIRSGRGKASGAWEWALMGASPRLS